MTLAAHEEVVDAEIVRTHTEWAEVIKSDLGRAVEGIVSAGKNLTSAKADVNHGEWQDMLDDIGISQPYAYKLMQIGKRFTNHSSWNDLPGSIAALYELSRMDSSDIEDGIESGVITPNMKIKDAKAFANDEWPVVPEPRDNGENRHTDVINGTRNDLNLIGGNYIRYVKAVGKEVPREDLPQRGNEYIIQYLRDNLAEITAATEAAINQLEGERK